MAAADLASERTATPGRSASGLAPGVAGLGRTVGAGRSARCASGGQHRHQRPRPGRRRGHALSPLERKPSRHRLRCDRRRRGLCADQPPCDRRRTAHRGAPERWPRVGGRAGRHRPGDRPGPAQAACRQARWPAGHRVRCRQGPAGGRHRAGHRQPLRRRPDGDRRHRQRAAAAAAGHQCVRELHPDRCRHQPRQLRRRAGRRARTSGRHQQRDLLAQRRQPRPGLRDPGGDGGRGDAGAAQRGPRGARLDGRADARALGRVGRGAAPARRTQRRAGQRRGARRAGRQGRREAGRCDAARRRAGGRQPRGLAQRGGAAEARQRGGVAACSAAPRPCS